MKYMAFATLSCMPLDSDRRCVPLLGWDNYPVSVAGNQVLDEEPDPQAQSFCRPMPA